MKLFDSALPQNYSKVLFEEKCSDLAPEHTDKMLNIMFTAVSNLLNQSKSMTQPTAFTFKAVDGSIIAASIIQFFENEDSSKPGNWSLVWTFDGADIPETALVIDFNDPQTHSYFRAAAGEKYGIKFEDTASLIDCMVVLIQQLKKWLDDNAKEGSEVMVELDGIFQARVAVENGEKVFAIEPAGEIKNLIKDDVAIEK